MSTLDNKINKAFIVKNETNILNSNSKLFWFSEQDVFLTDEQTIFDTDNSDLKFNFEINSIEFQNGKKLSLYAKYDNL